MIPTAEGDLLRFRKARHTDGPTKDNADEGHAVHARTGGTHQAQERKCIAIRSPPGRRTARHSFHGTRQRGMVARRQQNPPPAQALGRFCRHARRAHAIELVESAVGCWYNVSVKLHDSHDSKDIMRRGRSLYESKLRSQLEPNHSGEFLVLNVDTGEYEIDADDVAASRRARIRFADAPLITLRIGHATAFRLGGHRLKNK